MNNISDRTRKDIADAIKAILGELAAVNFDKAMKEFLSKPVTEENLKKIRDLSALVAKRRDEIRSVYNNMPMPPEALLKSKPLAAATTEKVAMADIYFGEDLQRSVDAGIKTIFIYGKELKSDEEAYNFVRASGYEGSLEDITFIKMGESDTYEKVLSTIAEKTKVSSDNIGIRAVKDDFNFASDKTEIPGKLLEIQLVEMNGQQVYAAMNSYQTLLKMLLAAEGEVLPPGVQDTTIKGIFRYLPRAIPIDYEKEVKTYMEAIRVIRTAA